jgi:hypothetical protein
MATQVRLMAEDLWETIGGQLCPCQRPDVPHWCEDCKRRIDTIQAAISSYADDFMVSRDNLMALVQVVARWSVRVWPDNGEYDYVVSQAKVLATTNNGERMKPKEQNALDAIVDTVLAYRPKARSKPAVRRKRRKTILEKKRAKP